MYQWQQIETEDSRETWQDILAEFPDAQPFQNFDFADSYKGLGWKPLHFVCFDNEDKPVSAALVLTRRLPLGIGFAWCPGGPANSEYGEEIGSLPDAVKSAGKFRGLFFRGRFDKKLDTKDSIKLTSEGWHRAIFPMGSNYSIELNLENPESHIGQLSVNWRRNLKRSKTNDLKVSREFNPDTAEMRDIYREMEASKGLGVLCTEEKLRQLFKEGNKNIVLLTCRDKEGNLLGFRSAIIQGRNGCDYLAATTLEGRDMRSSYFTMWEMLEYCRSIGVTSYDMGGIDPVTNQGVYRFKKGLGGRTVEFLGEWDWASSDGLRYLGNFLLARKQGFGGKASKKARPKRKLADLYYATARLFNL